MRNLYIILIVIIGLFIFSGCQENPYNEMSINDESQDETVTLRFLTIGEPPKTGVDELYEQLDILTQNELGCTVRFDFIPWGDERNQINIAIASGEYDFYPGGIFSDYKVMSAKNAFLELNEYLDLVPELVEHYIVDHNNYLEDARIGENLYGIPQFNGKGLMTTGDGFFFREDLRIEWGLPEIVDFKSMEAFLYRAKREEQYQSVPLITDNRIWTSLWYMLASDKYFELASVLETPYVVIDKETMKVINRFETPEFLVILEYLNKWYDDGILESSLISLSDNEGLRGLALMISDSKPCETNATLGSMNKYYIPELYESHPEWVFGYFNYQNEVKDIYLAPQTQSTVISISSKSNYPETAIRFLEKIHVDQRYYDLVNYGVLGSNYDLMDGYVNYDNIDDENSFSGLTGVGDYLMNYQEKSQNSHWQYEVFEVELERRTKLTKDASIYPLGEFVVDSTKIISITEVLDRYFEQNFKPLVCGVESHYEEQLELSNTQIMSEGLSEYIDEVQSQLDEYLSK